MPQSSGKKFTYSLIQKEAFGSLRSGVKACAKKGIQAQNRIIKAKKREGYWTIKISTSIYAKNSNEQSGKGFLL